MTAKRTAAAVIFLLVAGARASEACKCELEPVCQSYWTSSAVFVGIVQDITVVEQPTSRTRAGTEKQRLVRFVVRRAWKGVTGPTVEVTTGMGSGDCGFDFEIGQEYVVDASDWNGGLRTGICSFTGRVPASREVLAFLDNLTSPSAGGARIYGRVQSSAPKLEWTQAPPRALSGVLVSLDGPGGRREARTDDAGYYSIEGLAAGSYAITLDLPPDAQPMRSGSPVITLPDARACAQRSFMTRPSGAIAGQVLDTLGKPILQGGGRPQVEVVRFEVLTEWYARLSESDDASRAFLERPPRLSTSIDGDGHFEIQGLPPGSYVLGVGIVSGVPTAVRIRPTFYPTGPTPEDAAIVVLRESEQRTLDPIVVNVVQPRRVAGRVVDADGRPRGDATIVAREAADPRRVTAASVRTDASGQFSLLLFDDVAYELRVFAGSDRTTNYGQATLPFVKVSADLSPILLKLEPLPRR